MKTRAIVIGGLYLGLLALSWALEEPLPEARPGAGPGRVALEVAPHGERGPLAGSRARLSALHWPGVEGGGERTPVLCLHGSPGSARNFEDVGARLAASGWDVWAIDLPGFGRSVGPVGGHSILAHARAALAALDALGIERAHLVAWSMGGGVALHMADLAPERTASIALVSSIGVQEAEGSGSYLFEHLKYLVLRAGVFAVDRLVPHFGAFAGFSRDARAFALNFWETDQRPLRGVMQRLAVPTLIAHGREDFLAPWWAAEVSHGLIATSRLVLFDAGHFLPISPPYGQADRLTEELAPFLARHDAPGGTEVHASVDLDPRPAGLRGLEPAAYALPRLAPWWLLALAVGLAAARAPLRTGVVSGGLVGALQLDLGLAALCGALGVALSVLVARPGPGGRTWGLARALAAFLGWVLVAMILSGVAGALLRAALGASLPRSAGPLAAIALLLFGAVLVARRRRGAQEATP